ncbi:hypothetical protein TNCT_74021 [Trichonephila clavata]|uniref:Uncharacterized protein n=1 Tax=Trichonephila clavata TaxID=2740835 RepID=A0A8X6G9Z8_TRICU|nr:hypothetical protein TNCT_74021 [Trichonephila clavata]
MPKFSQTLRDEDDVRIALRCELKHSQWVTHLENLLFIKDVKLSCLEEGYILDDSKINQEELINVSFTREESFDINKKSSYWV